MRAPFDLWREISDAIRARLGPAFPITDKMIREVLTRLETNDRVAFAGEDSGGMALLRISSLRTDRSLDSLTVVVPKGMAQRFIPAPAIQPEISSEGW